MLAGVCAAVMAVNQYTETEFDALAVQIRARFVLLSPNGCLPAASAPMASWYAVYCVAAPTPTPSRADSAALRLYAIRDPTMFMDAGNWRLRPPFSGAHHLWVPTSGEMAVFPAGLTHEVALVRSTGTLTLVNVRARFVGSGGAWMPPW